MANINLTQDLFDNIKNSLQQILNIREVFINKIEELQLPEHIRFILLQQKDGVALLNQLAQIRHISMKALIENTDQLSPELKFFQNLTTFISQTAEVTNYAHTGPDYSLLITATQKTQDTISHLLNATYRLKPLLESNNNGFQAKLLTLSESLFQLIEKCNNTKIKKTLKK